nr:MAG TPA: hypothetical protein [Caudoviricetes sp.]
MNKYNLAKSAEQSNKDCFFIGLKMYAKLG